MELEITWARVVRIWWAYLWRNVLAIVASMIAGGIVGFVLGFAGASIGVQTDIIRVVSMILGGAIGLAFSVVPFWLVLGKDFGAFRLVLVRNEPGVTPTASQATGVYTV